MEKKFKNGLILGKFLPPHLGHQYLVTNGIMQCDNLTVLVCTLNREPIPGHLRFKWMKQLCQEHPHNFHDNNMKVNVVHIDYDLPQEPSEHSDFWNIWCGLIKKHCPEIQAIFTSEDYGDELARQMNITHVCVDKPRLKMPTSGTAIRNNPYKNWDFITKYAKPYFLNRIYLMGPESTGKTVMSERLAKHFETNWVPEYGRTLWEKNGGHLDFIEFYEIAVMQRNIEDKMASMSIDKQLMICDTEVMTTKIFGEMMFPEQSEKLNPFLDYHINKQLKENTGHYFVMSPEGVEPVQDGTRNYLDDAPRKNHFDLIVFELRRRNIPFTILTGPYDQRFNQLCEYIEGILQHKEVTT